MRLKDHYRTLGVPPSATAAAIRKAFRRLALKYHPDQNQESPFAEGHFRELKEAYNVLGHEAKRARYDEERWLLGMGLHQKGSAQVSPAWLAGEVKKLRVHMAGIDTYRMSHSALQAYVLLLLADEHLAVLKERPEALLFIQDVLASVSGLRQGLLPPILERLYLLAGPDEAMTLLIRAALTARSKREKEERAFPWIMALIILVVGFATVALLAS